MPKESFCQGPFEALHYTLVLVDIHTTTPNLCPVPYQQLAHRAHELTPRIDLQKLGPFKWASLVNSCKGICNLFGLLCSQGLDCFILGGHINHSQGILVCLPP